ncbi:MAG: hypothetical protein K2X38_23060 [Gemmataceae bacterium]|nr:hypothetical protein [Gemmataceae bacterium]
MAIEQDGRFYCKYVHHENGRAPTRRVHEIMLQTRDGATYRLRGENLPDSLDLFTGPSVEGKHQLDVMLGLKEPRLTIFGFELFKKPKKRDLFFLWLGMTISLSIVVAGLKLILILS